MESSRSRPDSSSQTADHGPDPCVAAVRLSRGRRSRQPVRHRHSALGEQIAPRLSPAPKRHAAASPSLLAPRRPRVARDRGRRSFLKKLGAISDFAARRGARSGPPSPRHFNSWVRIASRATQGLDGRLPAPVRKHRHRCDPPHASQRTRARSSWARSTRTRPPSWVWPAVTRSVPTTRTTPTSGRWRSSCGAPARSSPRPLSLDPNRRQARGDGGPRARRQLVAGGGRTSTASRRARCPRPRSSVVTSIGSTASAEALGG